MPKVWLTVDKYGEYTVSPQRPDTENEVVEVEMNASLYRQIVSAVKKFEKFQNIMEKYYCEGVATPGHARRAR